MVADTGRDRVLFYSLHRRPSWAGSARTAPAPASSPAPATSRWTTSGNIYVADAENNRIQKFTADRRRSSGRRAALGTGTETLNTPIGVTWDSANDVLLVASTGQSLIKAWDADGVFRWKSPTRRRPSTPRPCAT